VELTIIVPTLNEAPCLPTVLDGLLAQPGVDVVLVVDGGSTDGTQDIARARGVRVIEQARPGFGEGIWEALAAVETELVCIVDADGSHRWQDIPRMRTVLDAGYDYVLASRYVGRPRWRGVGRWPWSTSEDDDLVHEWGNIGFAALARMLHGYPLHDLMMGFQMMRTVVVRTIELQENSQAFEAELKLRVLHAGFRMAEICTVEPRRIGGQAKLDAWKDGAATLRVVLSEWARAGFRRAR
jgi:glycosyltransferase involved in cell wall biosynthesis